MKLPHARITVKGPKSGITLDGHDISHGIRGGTIRFQLAEYPTLELELVAAPIEWEGEVAVRLHLEPAARDLLIRQGWTPPADVQNATPSEATA